MHHHPHLPPTFNDAVKKLKLSYFKRRQTARRQSKEAREEEEMVAFRKSLQEAQSLIYRNNPAITYHGRTIINPNYKGPNPCAGSRVIHDDYLFNEAVHNMTWDPTPLEAKPSEYAYWD
ncbi:hypothetical protein H2248_009831 [Termitomyces sp. 'cryptogamus']|nr:hypothetical protein H2248_009831 [Termitomyces sp. 'cryptogamus']